MGAELFDELRSAVAGEGDYAVIRIRATYAPAGGEGSRVFPPTYPGRDGATYLSEVRFVDGQRREDVVLDSVPSQANWAEDALLRARRQGRISLPLLELHHNGDVDVVLTSLEFPHRYADAYLRDSLLDGVAFDRTPLGKSLLAASMDDVLPLYVNDPGSLVFGAWNSHRKGRQQTFPRVYSSEVVGWDPVEGKRSAGRGDPLNLIGAARRGKEDGVWEYAASSEKVKGNRLSEIGHGQVAPNPQHGGVTISSATRMAMISLNGLDRLGFGAATHEAAVAARTVLAAYALLADRLAFGRPSLWLRSGCELVLLSESVEWVSRGGGTRPFKLPAQAAIDLFAMAVQHAAAAGLEMSSATVRLTPSQQLGKAIDFSLTKTESAGE